MSGTSDRPLLQRILIILSGVAFLGTTVFFAASTFINRPQPTDSEQPAPEGVAAGAAREQLEAQEVGYAAVLEREPDNLAALEGLARTRIELGKLEAALEPLETLADQEPDNEGLWQAIVAIQIQLQQYEAALEPLDRLIELAPEDEELQQLRAQLQQQLEAGSSEEAAPPEAAE